MRPGEFADASHISPGTRYLPVENLWRLRLSILIAMVAAFSIELTARRMEDSMAWGPLYARFLSLVALLLLTSTALYLIFLLKGRHVLKVMVGIAVSFLLVAQLIAIVRAAPLEGGIYSWADRWGAPIENTLLLAGLILLLTTFYFALLETVTVKSLLRLERTALVKEIAERERAQMELSRSRDELRSLSAHIETVREDERTRVSRELHDELGQTLTSLKIELANLRRKVAGHPECEKDSIEIITSMTEQLDASVQATRRIMTELHPAMLEELGLTSALEWLVAEFAKRTKIACKTDLHVNGFLPTKEQSRAVFRIVQECLTNVARHANATELFVHLSVKPDTINVEVSDNGVGIAASPYTTPTRSFGITGMRERATQLGGEFSIQTETGQGTSVRVSLPLGGGET